MQMRSVFRNVHGEWRAGWRIASMVLLLALLVTAVNLGWRATGLPGRQEGGPWWFLVFSTLISASALAVILILLRLFEGTGSSAIGLYFRRAAWRETGAGILIGATPICLLVGLSVLAGFGTITAAPINASHLAVVLLPTILAAFMLAAWEEFVLRGYVLRQLSLGLNPAAAVLITGILFGLMHSGNPGANWQGLLYTAIGGILMGWLVIRSGSLWLLIGYHFGWNATSATLFGLDLSGIAVDSSLFTSELTGPDWLTGGSYGFEAALPTAVFEVVVLSVVLLAIKRKQQDNSV